MREALEQHAAWPWLHQIAGIGPTLSAKLLARLDVWRAPTPSSFWAYCGLATVPGSEYACPLCGTRKTYPIGYNISGKHRQAGGDGDCPALLLSDRGSSEGVRVAQPRPRAGERPAYDHYAKKVCYLIGTCLLRATGPYAAYYHRERRKLGRDRPGWSRARLHLAALRKTEKLFLAHLWVVWAGAVNRPAVRPYAFGVLGRTRYVDPQDMIGRCLHPRASLQRALAPASPGDEP
jgi:hypothetical protein